MQKLLLSIIAIVFYAAALLATPYQSTEENDVPQKEDKVAFLIGGGCDEFFDNFTKDFNHWNTFLTNKGWNVRGFIDSSKTTEIKAVQPFQWDDFLTALNNLPQETPIQVLIIILSHGKQENGKHFICAQDNTWQKISDLTDPLNILLQNNIQVAIIDASCYSAHSVGELQNHTSCIMSMAGKAPGTGAITIKVAENLENTPFLGDKLSVEDIWFSVLEFSNQRLRQIPAISLFPAPAGQEIFPNKQDKPFFEENRDLFNGIFSEQSIQGVEEYFGNNFFKANSMGIIGVQYLRKFPARETRPCAQFYF